MNNAIDRQAAASTDIVVDVQSNALMAPLLIQYWTKSLRWRWVILAIVFGCLLTSVIITFLTPKRYTAQTQIEISRDQKQITNVAGLDSQQAGRDIEFYATQYALLRTRPLAARVVADLRLITNPLFFTSQGQNGRYQQLKAAGDTARLNREAVDLLLRNVTIDPVRTSRLVNVRFTGRSPELSSAIANQWIKAFLATGIDRQFASTADARRILEERIGVLRSRLEQSERRVVNYATNQGIVTLDQVRDDSGRSQVGRTLTASDLEALNSALNRATDARILAESRTGTNANYASELALNQAVALLRQQRAEVGGEYARLLVQFEPNYPLVREARQRLQSIDQQIAAEVSRVASGRNQEYNEAAKRERELRVRVGQLKRELDTQQRASIQYAIFQREADTNRQLYDALLQRYKEIGVSGTVAASNIAIVEPAEMPTKPSAPSLLINLAIGLLVGLALAAIAVFVLDQIDEGIHDPNDLTAQLGVSLLGHTPLISGSIQDELANNKSAFYEAYFSIRSNLSFATTRGFPRSIMVTSTRPGEGKSSSSLAMSVVVGRTDKTVLLIDADMRSPSIDALVGANNDKGLSNVLSGAENWRGLVQQTAYKNVSILSTGPMPPNAAELLSGEGLDRLMQECLQVYDHIIIDSPPILGLADAPLLIRAVEGCVMIIESKRVAVRAIKSSIDRLKAAHGQIFGAVLTKLQYRDGGYGYGHGYGYGYTYGADDQGQSRIV